MKKTSPQDPTNLELAAINDSLFRNDRIIIWLMISSMAIFIYCAMEFRQDRMEKVKELNTIENSNTEAGLSNISYHKKRPKAGTSGLLTTSNA